MHPPAFIGIPEVAERLGVTGGRVYQLIDDGRIPFVREGRRIRVPRASFDAWLRLQELKALENLRDPVGIARENILEPDELDRLEPGVGDIANGKGAR
ncbi:MAG: helix-turn-helix domain-containing protein [Chloroflexota bacterium]